MTCVAESHIGILLESVPCVAECHSLVMGTPRKPAAINCDTRGTNLALEDDMKTTAVANATVTPGSSIGRKVVFRNVLPNGIIVSTIRYRHALGGVMFETAIGLSNGVCTMWSDPIENFNKGAAEACHDEVAMIAGGQRRFDASSARQVAVIKMYACCVESFAMHIAA